MVGDGTGTHVAEEARLEGKRRKGLSRGWVVLEVDSLEMAVQGVYEVYSQVQCR